MATLEQPLTLTYASSARDQSFEFENYIFIETGGILPHVSKITH